MSTAVAIAYIAPPMLAFRPVWGHLAWWELERAKQGSFPRLHRAKRNPAPGQWSVAALYTVALLAIWPLLLPAALVSRALPKIGKEREAVIAQQRERLTELERELGLR